MYPSRGTLAISNSRDNEIGSVDDVATRKYVRNIRLACPGVNLD
jgi:hypothetical protein